MKPIVTEQTGKSYKATMLVGVLLMMLGVPSCFYAAATDSGMIGMGMAQLLMVGGICLTIAGAIGGWWNHG